MSHTMFPTGQPELGHGALLEELRAVTGPVDDRPTPEAAAWRAWAAYEDASLKHYRLRTLATRKNLDAAIGLRDRAMAAYRQWLYCTLFPATPRTTEDVKHGFECP